MKSYISSALPIEHAAIRRAWLVAGLDAAETEADRAGCRVTSFMGFSIQRSGGSFCEPFATEYSGNAHDEKIANIHPDNQIESPS